MPALFKSHIKKQFNEFQTQQITLYYIVLCCMDLTRMKSGFVGISEGQFETFLNQLCEILTYFMNKFILVE